MDEVTNNCWPSGSERAVDSTWLWDDGILPHVQATTTPPLPLSTTGLPRPEMPRAQTSAQPELPFWSNTSREPTFSGPKIDGRFSFAAVKVLRGWFEAHREHPYPGAEELHQLHLLTGLSKQQVKDWFSNSRRRNKTQRGLSSSPTGRSCDEARLEATTFKDIPRRRPTPVPFQDMSPLQRWEHSPPDHEPALLVDISQALAAVSQDLTVETSRHSDRSSSINLPSPRSVATSRSETTLDSSSSAFSYASHSSSRSRGQKRKPQKARRVRRAPGPSADLNTRLRNTYQCTFCPRTFKNKYDWQRHEKSLHLRFERWVCSAHGPTVMCTGGDAALLCAYCGLHDPDETHLQYHRYDQCLGKSQSERTFSRKDHLIQHLQFVHNASYVEDVMISWKPMSPNIRSRCGFCETSLESWNHRTDHLARHFREGSTMADWKGDWGFEPSVVEMLHNAMPPCKHLPLTTLDDLRKWLTKLLVVYRPHQL